MIKAIIYRGILLLHLTLYTNRINGQQLTDTTNSIAASLQEQGHDTVLIYKPYACPMMHRAADSSLLDEISYVITNKAKRLTIQRLTYERLYAGGNIITRNIIFKKDSTGIFNFLQTNFNRIFSDTIRPGLVKYRLNNKDTLIRNLSSHPCYTEVIVKTASGTNIGGICNEDVDEGIVRDLKGFIISRRENVNYAYNISTPVYHFFSRLQMLEADLKMVFKYQP